jgi:hypothetical protein
MIEPCKYCGYEPGVRAYRDKAGDIFYELACCEQAFYNFDKDELIKQWNEGQTNEQETAQEKDVE